MASGGGGTAGVEASWGRGDAMAGRICGEGEAAEQIWEVAEPSGGGGRRVDGGDRLGGREQIQREARRIRRRDGGRRRSRVVELAELGGRS